MLDDALKYIIYTVNYNCYQFLHISAQNLSKMFTKCEKQDNKLIRIVDSYDISK